MGWANCSMCVGEKRKLVIPPDMAYGDRSMGSIKAGSTLGRFLSWCRLFLVRGLFLRCAAFVDWILLIVVFDVELMEIKGVPLVKQEL